MASTVIGKPTARRVASSSRTSPIDAVTMSIAVGCPPGRKLRVEQDEVPGGERTGDREQPVENRDVLARRRLNAGRQGIQGRARARGAATAPRCRSAPEAEYERQRRRVPELEQGPGDRDAEDQLARESGRACGRRCRPRRRAARSGGNAAAGCVIAFSSVRLLRRRKGRTPAAPPFSVRALGQRPTPR